MLCGNDCCVVFMPVWLASIMEQETRNQFNTALKVNIDTESSDIDAIWKQHAIVILIENHEDT